MGNCLDMHKLNWILLPTSWLHSSPSRLRKITVFFYFFSPFFFPSFFYFLLFFLFFLCLLCIWKTFSYFLDGNCQQDGLGYGREAREGVNIREHFKWKKNTVAQLVDNFHLGNKEEEKRPHLKSPPRMSEPLTKWSIWERSQFSEEIISSEVT